MNSLKKKGTLSDLSLNRCACSRGHRACAFSALTSTVTALTVTSKAVGGSLSLAALPEGVLFWS